MNKDFRIKITRKTREKTYFKITHISRAFLQKIRRGDGCPGKNWILQSSCFPEVCSSERTLFVWGEDRHRNDESLNLPNHQFKLLQEDIELITNSDTIEKEFFRRFPTKKGSKIPL